MKKINPIHKIDYNLKLNEIITAKRTTQGKNLALILPDLLKRFEQYNKTCTNLEKLKATPKKIQPHKDALKELYEMPITCVEDLLKQIKAIKPRCCPYCGKHAIPETLDHYLPKEKYPEFSIYYQNLIPCCGRCNNLKSTNIIENNERVIFNPYFDNFLDDIFLKVIIYIDKKSSLPIFEIEIDDSLIGNKSKNICEKHLTKLKLRGDYIDYFSDGVQHIKNKYKPENIKVDLDTLKFDITRELNAEIKRFGVNNWICALYRAILANESFLKNYYKDILT